MNMVFRLLIISASVICLTFFGEGVASSKSASESGSSAVQKSAASITKCNTKDVKQGKRDGWEDVAFGSEINDGDYLELIRTIAYTVRDRDSEPLSDFFQDQVDELAEKLGPELQQLGERAVADLLVRAFLDNGDSQRILEGGLEVDAGIARINCWIEITYGEPKTYECRQYFVCPYLPFEKTCWTNSMCSTLEPVTRKLDWFPKYLPYVRYRTNSNVPQLDLQNLSHLISRIESDFTELQDFEYELRQDTSLSDGQIRQRLADEARGIIVDEVAAYVEENISVVPASSYYRLLDNAMRRILARKKLDSLSYVQISQELENSIEDILREVIAEFNQQVPNVISTHPGSLLFDWAESNRVEKRAEISGKGAWLVVWGANVDEIEYIEFSAAVASAGPTAGGSLFAYFGTYLEKTISKIERQVPSISQRVIKELLVKAIQNPGQTFSHQNLEIQAGIATYDRWVKFNYPKIDFRRCDQALGGQNYEYPCGLTFAVSSVHIDDVPNHHQPYFKFRFTDGSLPEPSGSNSVEELTYFGCGYGETDVYVDSKSQVTGEGTLEQPFAKINMGVQCVRSGGTVWITGSVYDEPIVIDRPVTLRNRNGDVTIR